jgi:hypothetical protein
MFEHRVRSAPYGLCETHGKGSVARSRPGDQVKPLIKEADLLLFRKHNLNINAMIHNILGHFHSYSSGHYIPCGNCCARSQKRDIGRYSDATNFNQLSLSQYYFPHCFIASHVVPTLETSPKKCWSIFHSPQSCYMFWPSYLSRLKQTS